MLLIILGSRPDGLELHNACPPLGDTIPIPICMTRTVAYWPPIFHYATIPVPFFNSGRKSRALNWMIGFSK
jgi:hypothetical protein